MVCVWWRANNNLPVHAYISLLKTNWPMAPYLLPLTPFKLEFKFYKATTPMNIINSHVLAWQCATSR